MNGPASSVPAPEWWLADPARWELLAFEGGHDEDGLPRDLNATDRTAVLDTLLHVPPSPRRSDFARHLLVQETHWHGHMWGFSHGIEVAALLVAEDRRVEDVWTLWDAVSRSFDTWCGMPHRVLVSAGRSRTVAHVSASEHPDRGPLLERLGELGEMTDEETADALTRRLRYYANRSAVPSPSSE